MCYSIAQTGVACRRSTMINENTKEEVRQRVDIVSVVGRYVKLQKAGHYYKGLCPFHDDKKSPSFTVTPDKNIFYCFGCGKGGDVFTFISEIEGVGFSEALTMLAEEAGVETRQSRSQEGSPTKGGSDDTHNHVTKKQLYHIHRMAASFFYANVRQNERAISFFKTRNLDPRIVKEFMLGYATDSWTSFLDFATNRGVPFEVLREAGLVVEKNAKGRGYDRFRDRIIYPLFDITSRVVGFGGRGLDNDATPKYLNSSESAIYKKSRLLYGIHKIRETSALEDYIFVVEGYMDYLMLYQHDIRNCVATCGTSLTEQHIDVLRRFVNKIIFVFDGDDAGKKAAQRAARISIAKGMTSEVFLLPQGEDPDSIVRQWGKEEFLRNASETVSAFDFVIECAREEADLATPVGIVACVDNLAEFIQSIPDSLIQSYFVSHCADRLNIPEAQVYARLPKKSRIRNSSGTQEAASRSNVDYRRYLSTIEGHFFRLLLADSGLFEKAIERISPQIFSNRFSAELFSIILYAYRNNGLERLVEYARGVHMKNVCAMLQSQPPVQGDAAAELAHTMHRLEIKYIRGKLRSIRSRLKTVENEQTKKELLEENVELTRWLQEKTEYSYDQ